MFAGNTLYCGNRQQHGQSKGFVHHGYRGEYGQMFNTEYGLPQYQPYQPVYGETGEGCGAGSICINVLIKSVNVMLSISSSSSVLFSGVSNS